MLYVFTCATIILIEYFFALHRVTDLGFPVGRC